MGGNGDGDCTPELADVPPHRRSWAATSETDCQSPGRPEDIASPDTPPVIGRQNTRRKAPKTPSRAKIPDEVAKKLQREFKIAMRGGSAEQLLRKYDKDKSGSFSGDEMVKLVRFAMRIPAAVVTDVDIVALVKALDDDDTGTLSIEELVDFIERGSECFAPRWKPPPSQDSGPVVATKQVAVPIVQRHHWLQADVVECGSDMPVACVNSIDPAICDYLVAAMGYDPGVLYASIFGYPQVQQMQVEQVEKQPKIKPSITGTGKKTKNYQRGVSKAPPVAAQERAGQSVCREAVQEVRQRQGWNSQLGGAKETHPDGVALVRSQLSRQGHRSACGGAGRRWESDTVYRRVDGFRREGLGYLLQ